MKLSLMTTRTAADHTSTSKTPRPQLTSRFMPHPPCDALPSHLTALCCGESPAFTARQCIAHANAWRAGEGLPPLESINAESTAKVHAGKLVQTRIDEQVVRERRDESPKQAKAKPAQPPKTPPRTTLPPCIHLLDVIREEGCRLCGGRHVIAPIHGCGVHGECTQNNYGLKGAAKFLATCITCLDYAEIGGLETVPK